MGATLCINQTKRTWIGHNFKKRSSLRGPFIHTVELFPCSRKQLRSKDRGGSRPYRWEADETNMWRGDGIEVHGCDGVEHLALVHDAVTRHWSSKKKRSYNLDSPDDIPRKKAAKTVPSDRKPSDLLAVLFQPLDFLEHLGILSIASLRSYIIRAHTSSATLSPPQSIPSYVDSDWLFVATRDTSSTPLESSLLGAHFSSSIVRFASARLDGFPHIPWTRTTR